MVIPKEKIKKERSQFGIMKQINNLLNSLDPKQRASTLAWLWTEHGSPQTPAGPLYQVPTLFNASGGDQQRDHH